MRDEFPIVNVRRGLARLPRPMQVIACSDCGREDALSAHGGRMSADHVAGTFRQRGWIVGDVGKHLCPECVTRRRAERKVEKEKVAMASQVEKEKVKDVPARSPDASAKIAEMYMLFDEAYDRVAKNYKTGWSDERIARETGLALTFVAKRREDDFGPVVIDTSAEDLHSEIGVATTKIALLLTAQERVAASLKEVQAHLAKISKLSASVIAKR